MADTFGESDPLHRRARALVAAHEAKTAPPEPFDALACDLARFQARHVEGYARLCRARGVHLDTITRASQAPAVPTDAFKLARVATFPEEATRALIGTRTKEAFRLGGPVRVRLIDAAPFAGALRFEIMRAGAEPRGGRKSTGPTPFKAIRRDKRR